MNRFIQTLLLLLSTIPSARAQNPITAMRQFGLLGTWGADCTAPITDAMILLRFTDTSLGEPRLILSHPDDIFYESTIRAATITQPNQIQLTIESGLTSPLDSLTFTLTNNTLTLTSPTTQPVPPLHRCISE